MTAASGKTVLVLEDEFLLSLEAVDSLEEIGAVVVGPAHRIESALKLLDMKRPDAALIDVNINGSSSVDVARRLTDLGVPFIVATGYGAQNAVPGGSEIIDKPYSREQIQSALLRIFDGTGEHA